MADLPLRALRDVCWSFVGAPFADRAEFDAAVRQYQIRIRKRDSWRPDAVALPAGQVAIRYRCWQGDEQLETVVVLAADDGAAFTAGELLFKVHNAVVERLRDLDHHFFEGLVLDGWMPETGVPRYTLRQGS